MIPCRDCLIIPICREKTYRKLMTECSRVENYFYFPHGSPPSRGYRRYLFNREISELVKILNAKKWRVVQEEGYKGVTIGDLTDEER